MPRAANTLFSSCQQLHMSCLFPLRGFRLATPQRYRCLAFQSSLRIGLRNVSSTYEKTTGSKPTTRRIRNIVLGTSIVLALGAGYIYATDTRASAHRWVIPPMMRWFYPDAEDAHHAG